MSAAPKSSPSGTPPQVLAAFSPETPPADTLRFAPFTMMHWLALERVKCPLIGGLKKKPAAMMDLLRALCIVSANGLEVKRMLEGGEPAIEDAARRFASTVTPHAVRGCALKIVAHIDQAFVTAIPETAGEEASDGNPFPNGPPPATASGSA